MKKLLFLFIISLLFLSLYSCSKGFYYNSSGDMIAVKGSWQNKWAEEHLITVKDTFSNGWGKKEKDFIYKINNEPYSGYIYYLGGINPVPYKIDIQSYKRIPEKKNLGKIKALVNHEINPKKLFNIYELKPSLNYKKDTLLYVTYFNKYLYKNGLLIEHYMNNIKKFPKDKSRKKKK